LVQPYYSAKIIFQEKSINELEKRHLMLQDVDGGHAEATYVIKQDKKGRFKLKLYSAIPIATAPPVADNTTVVEYTSVPRPVSTTISVTETTTVTEDINKGKDEIKIDMDLGGINVDMDVQVDMDSEKDLDINMDENIGMDVDIDMNTNGTTTTMTTTTTSTTVNGVTTENVDIEFTTEIHVTGVHTDMDVNTEMNTGGTITSKGEKDCLGKVMYGTEFNDAKKSITSKTFEEDKLTVSKQIAGNICLSSKQVKEIMMLFAHEGTKLEFAKFAYNTVFDPGNYYQVNDAFTHSGSIDELNEFLPR